MTTKPWIYTAVVFLFWTLVPELRRLMDWKSNFSSVSVVIVLPLVVLVPSVIAVAYGRRLANVDGRLKALAWIWLGGFGYALAIGLASQNYFAAVYTFADFCLATFFGLWLASVDTSPLALYERVASFLLALAVPIAVYAAFQFAVLPDWDANWMRHAKIISIGVAAPFKFRPFSTLNSPGPLADFLVAVLTLNLPRLKGARIVRIGQMALCAVVLLLTQVRSGWLGMIVALIVFVALSPNKARNLFAVGVFGAVLLLFVTNASAIFGDNAAGDLLQRRLNTTSSLSTDASVQNRQEYLGDTLTAALRQPTGSGLGTLGTAAKLGGGGETVDFDNGDVARLVEMGWFGTACYFAAVLGGLALTWLRWRSHAQAGDAELESVCAAALAFEAALVVLDVSSDHHNALAGVLFWMVLAIVFAREGRDRTPTGPRPVVAKARPVARPARPARTLR